MYYGANDQMSDLQLEATLPDDEVPTELNFHDTAEVEMRESLSERSLIHI